MHDAVQVIGNTVGLRVFECLVIEMIQFIWVDGYVVIPIRSIVLMSESNQVAFINLTKYHFLAFAFFFLDFNKIT